MSKVLYLEADEDITSAVDKLKGAEDTSVEVVVPKRSTLLQSMINLKLLKKAATESKKDLVLVTSDRLSSHLAGRAGLAVAAKVGAEAKVPESEVAEPDQNEVIDAGTAETEAESSKTDDEMPIPAAVAGAAVGAAVARDDAEKPETPAGSSAEPVMNKKELHDEPKEAKSKTKTGRVPDFNALQHKILWVGLAVAAIVLVFLINFFITKATVTIFAKGAQVPVSTSFTADPTVPSSNIPGGVLKAQELSSSKSLSEQVPATGQKDVGTKSSGQITIKNCDDSNAHVFPAGSTVTAQGKNFKSNDAVTIPGGVFAGGGTICNSPTASVGVTAAENGDSYNLAATSYTSPSLNSNYRISGGQMSGGTSKKVTIVQQGDVDKAVADMLSKDKDGAQSDLKGKAAKGQQMIDASFSQTPSNITSDIAVGGEAANVNVKVTAGYYALAISGDDLNKFLTAQVQKQVGVNDQVYDSGAGSAEMKVPKPATGAQVVTITTTASAGPKLDTEAIAKTIRGQKYGDAKDAISKLPGVDHVEITITPGWNTKLPRRSSQIKITVKVAGG